jgi:hypothetical protein
MDEGLLQQQQQGQQQQQQRQYLYFCTSKSSKLEYLAAPRSAPILSRHSLNACEKNVCARISQMRAIDALLKL